MKGKLFTFVLGTAALITFLVWLNKKLSDHPDMSSDGDMNDDHFEEYTYSDMFTFNQMKEWVQDRDTLIKNNCKVLIAKINSTTNPELLRILKNKPIDHENNLIMAVMNTETKEIVDFVIIKYNSLDKKLEDILMKGNGTLVIGGE